MRRLDLADAAAVDQPGGAAIAGARVDFVELDQARAASGSAVPATSEDQDDEDDRDRLEQHALAHPLLRLLAGDVLARRHDITPRTST